MTIQTPAHTAEILIRALPYIRRFRKKIVVVKYGGNAMADEVAKNNFARDIVLLQLVGVRPVVVHGGGPQIQSMLDRIGKQSQFIDGMRVTDADTMYIAEMVLGGHVNKEITERISAQGSAAIGLTGKDSQLLRAQKMESVDDLGFVGTVQSVNAAVLTTLIREHFIPVIAPIGVDTDGAVYNINADLAAGKIAESLQAEKLVLLTNTDGVLDSNKQLIQKIDAHTVETLIAGGTITGGMIPKTRCAATAVTRGVASAHILNGCTPHALLLEFLTDEGVGTIIH